MIRQPPISTLTDTLFPYSTLFLSLGGGFLSNFTDSKVPSVQNLMSGMGVNDLTTQLTSLTPSTDEIQTITREVEQKFSDISDVISSKRSEEHTSELQSLMRISYAVFCLKKKKKKINKQKTYNINNQ